MRAGQCQPRCHQPPRRGPVQTYHVRVGHKTVKPPNRPAHLALPDPLLWRRLQELIDDGPRIRFGRHGVFLAMDHPPLVFFVDGQVERAVGQDPFGSCDPGLHAPGHDDDHFDVKRGEFETEGVAIGVEGGFAGIVGACERMT